MGRIVCGIDDFRVAIPHANKYAGYMRNDDTQFIGREIELKKLADLYRVAAAKLVVVYGRRRIGKSELIKHFARKHQFLYIEGLENETQAVQIQHCAEQLLRQIKEPMLANVKCKNWKDLFDLLTAYFAKQDKKVVIALDELQWMAGNRSALVHLLKFYWDNHWKNQKVLMILCGSIASFMVKKVINSKALYGRISSEILLGPLKPNECAQWLHRRGKSEILRYLLTLGGIPKYLEEIRQTQSFEANIEALCFKSDGFLFNEVDKIFFSQFKEARTYKKIVNKIGTGIVSLDEIARHLKMPSGGGVKEYLTNLELAGMIKRFKPLHETSQKMTRYKLSDEFLIFFLKYIAPVTHRILAAPGTKYFKKQVLPVWQPWLGFAFENFCQKYAMNIASAAGFADEVIDFGPYFSFAEQKGFQIDLIYERTGGVLTVCEIKYLEAPVATSVIPELERKIALLPKKRGITVEKMLIAPQGASTALLESKYFHHVVTLDELLFPNC